MPKIFKLSEQNFTTRGAELPQFDMLSGARISKMAGAERMVFDFRKLPPGKYSFPYHFHHNAEELFYIVSGKCSLRTPEGVTHQMFNHTDEPCVYLDIRTFDRVDVAEYPDSNKMTAMPPGKFFKQDSAVSYLTGEENVEEIWKNLKSTINAE
jgi:uncharacterized cupin superfamily protein